MNYDRGSSTILLYMLATHPSSDDDASGLSSSDDDVLGIRKPLSVLASLNALSEPKRGPK